MGFGCGPGIMAERFQIKRHAGVELLASVAPPPAAATLPVGRHVDLLGCDLLMAAGVRAPAGCGDVAVAGIDDADSITRRQLEAETDAAAIDHFPPAGLWRQGSESINLRYAQGAIES